MKEEAVRRLFNMSRVELQSVLDYLKNLSFDEKKKLFDEIYEYRMKHKEGGWDTDDFYYILKFKIKKETP